MDDMMADLRLKMSDLLEENEKLKMENEDEDLVSSSTLPKVAGNSIIPPRSSSVVELLPHLAQNEKLSPVSEKAELEKLRLENQVLVAFLLQQKIED